jgi:hypothetical protein
VRCSVTLAPQGGIRFHARGAEEPHKRTRNRTLERSGGTMMNDDDINLCLMHYDLCAVIQRSGTSFFILFLALVKDRCCGFDELCLYREKEKQKCLSCAVRCGDASKHPVAPVLFSSPLLRLAFFRKRRERSGEEGKKRRKKKKKKRTSHTLQRFIYITMHLPPPSTSSSPPRDPPARDGGGRSGLYVKEEVSSPYFSRMRRLHESCRLLAPERSGASWNL